MRPRPVPGTGRGSWRQVLGSDPETRLIQPGGEEALDLAAAARPLEPRCDGLALDDDERRHLGDPEALDEIGPVLLGDTEDPEGPVVSAPLQDLGQKALDAAALTGQARVEEDQPRLLARQCGGGHCQIAPPWF